MDDVRSDYGDQCITEEMPRNDEEFKSWVGELLHDFDSDDCTCGANDDDDNDECDSDCCGGTEAGDEMDEDSTAGPSGKQEE